MRQLRVPLGESKPEMRTKEPKTGTRRGRVPEENGHQCKKRTASVKGEGGARPQGGGKSSPILGKYANGNEGM